MKKTITTAIIIATLWASSHAQFFVGTHMLLLNIPANNVRPTSPWPLTKMKAIAAIPVAISLWCAISPGSEWIERLLTERLANMDKELAIIQNKVDKEDVDFLIRIKISSARKALQESIEALEKIDKEEGNLFTLIPSLRGAYRMASETVVEYYTQYNSLQTGYSVVDNVIRGLQHLRIED